MSQVTISSFTPLQCHRLIEETRILQTEISQSEMKDELTLKIQDCLNLITQDLNNSALTPQSFDRHITLLQHTLCDSLTLAPLDPFAVIGSDGHTYGQLSLAVFRLSQKDESIQHRSPLHLEDPTPLTTKAHKVARIFIEWLGKHNALLYSKTLEETYLKLLSRKIQLQYRDMHHRILNLWKDVSNQSAATLQSWIIEFKKQLETQAESWTQRLRDFSDARRMRFEALNKKLDMFEVEQRQDFAKIQAHLDEREEHLRRNALLLSRMDEIAPDEKQYIEDLQQSLQKRLQESLQPFSTQRERYADEKLVEIQNSEVQNQISFEQNLLEVKQLRKIIKSLSDESDRLVNSDIPETKRQIQDGRSALETLQKQSQDLERAVAEMEDKKNDGIFKALSALGGCVFSTWVLNSLIHSSLFSVSVFSNRHGVGFTVFSK